jgi:hypothetical protein
MTKFTTDEGIKRFIRRLRKMGIDERLDKLGALDSDSVRIFDYVFEYKKAGQPHKIFKKFKIAHRIRFTLKY